MDEYCLLAAFIGTLLVMCGLYIADPIAMVVGSGYCVIHVDPIEPDDAG